MCLLAFLKSVQVLFLNMSNMLELSGLFVCLRRLVQFVSAWGDRKKIAGLWFVNGGSVPRLTLWLLQ